MRLDPHRFSKAVRGDPAGRPKSQSRSCSPSPCVRGSFRPNAPGRVRIQAPPPPVGSTSSGIPLGCLAAPRSPRAYLVRVTAELHSCSHFGPDCNGRPSFVMASRRPRAVADWRPANLLGHPLYAAGHHAHQQAVARSRAGHEIPHDGSTSGTSTACVPGVRQRYYNCRACGTHRAPPVRV